jgi:hypothetical protein
MQGTINFIKSIDSELVIGCEITSREYILKFYDT